MSARMDLDFGVAALADYDEDGHLQIQTDSPSIDGAGATRAATALLPYGMIARPLDPDGSGADIGAGTPLLTMMSGDDRYVIPFADPRDLTKIPKVKKGAVGLYGGSGKFRSLILIDGLDPNGKYRSGSISLLASFDAGGTKKSMGVIMNVREAGKEEISIDHVAGHRITMSATGSKPIVLMNAAADAWVEVNDGGVVLSGATNVQGSLKVGSKNAQAVALGAPVIDCIEQIVVALNALEGALSGVLGAQPTTTTALKAALTPLRAMINRIKAKHLETT